MKSALLAVGVVAILAGCESPPPAAAPVPQEPGGTDISADKCLAIAGAKRERKPNEPSRITVKHILVKYAGAKSAAPSVLRSREAACVRAVEARERMEKGLAFGDAVNLYSEEPGASTREGLVGSVERKDVVPAFADAAFELARGEVSHVVETEYGFHLILRSE